MSFHEACDWSLIRATAAALLAVPVSRSLSRLLTTSGRWNIPLAVLVLSPLLAPELLVGYGWSSFALTQLHHPVINHWLYFGLILLKFLPAGVIARVCSPPPPVSSMASHSDRLLGPNRNWQRALGIRVRGEFLRELPVAGVVFLLVFQEFEIASLMQIPAWTVHLFDSQTVGLQPGETFRRMLVPVAIEFLVLVPLIHFCLRVGNSRAARSQELEFRPGGSVSLGGAVAVLAFLLLWVTPLGLIAASGMSGIESFAQNRVLVKSFALDLSAAIVLGTGTAILALSFSRILLHSVRPVAEFARIQTKCQKLNSCESSYGQSEIAAHVSRLTRGAIFWLCMAPGLAGSLVVCLAILVSIQIPLLQPLRSTIFPAVFALTLFALPRAVLVQLLIGTGKRSENGHLAELLSRAPDSSRSSRGMRLMWATEAKWLFITGCVIFYWAMMNLTAAAYLCPPTTVSIFGSSMGVVPLPVRLYDMMHFGRNGPLSIMALLSVVVPGMLMIGAGWLLPGLYVRLRRRLARP
jgi:hypothetical protein